MDKPNPANLWTGYPLTGAPIYVNPQLHKKTSPKPPTPPNSVMVRCPVDVLITDSQGNRVGMLPTGNPVEEFPVVVSHATENGKTLGWYFDLPEGVYNTVITGESTGTFNLLVSGEVAGGRCLDYGDQPIASGAQARITLDADNPTPPLVLPDGKEIMPNVLEIGAGTPNQPPTASFSIMPENPQVGDTIVVVGTASDPDGDMLTCWWYLDGEHIWELDDFSSWEWEDTEAGEYTITLVVDDGSESDEYSMAVTVVGDGGRGVGGSVIIGILFIIIIAAVAVFLIRRRRKKEVTQQEQDSWRDVGPPA